MEIFASKLRPMQYWHLQAEQRLQKWEEGKEEGHSTGFTALDQLMRLIDGELTVIAARPSQGKTALGMQIIESMAQNMQKGGKDGCIAVFSAEMSGWSLYLRMAAALCGVNTYKLSIQQGEEGDARKLRNAMKQLRELPIWIDDSTSPSTAQMLEQLEELNDSSPVKAMLFDFLELGARDTGKGSSEEQRISAITTNLKAIAKTLNIPVIALSQLNRDVENRANKMPVLSDLRYSGMIEQLADKVVFLMRPEYYIERGMSVDAAIGDEKGVAYVQVAKHRNGPVGLAKLAFQKDFARFGNLHRERIDLNG